MWEEKENKFIKENKWIWEEKRECKIKKKGGFKEFKYKQNAEEKTKRSNTIINIVNWNKLIKWNAANLNSIYLNYFPKETWIRILPKLQNLKRIIYSANS